MFMLSDRYNDSEFIQIRGLRPMCYSMCELIFNLYFFSSLIEQTHVYSASPRSYSNWRKPIFVSLRQKGSTKFKFFHLFNYVTTQ